MLTEGPNHKGSEVLRQQEIEWSAPQLDLSRLLRAFPSASRAITERIAGAALISRIMYRLGSAEKRWEDDSPLRLLSWLRQDLYREIALLNKGTMVE